MTHVGIVGAGAAAATTTHVLDEALPDAEITVIEKSGGVCGRAATRRHEDITYDYGANYLKDDDERVTELVTETLDTEGLVDIDEPIYAYEADGEIGEGRDADDHKWTYESGLTQIAKRLFARTDATVNLDTRIETISRVEESTGEGIDDHDEQWRLTDTDGRQWGPFDALVLNPPAPQTAGLLRDAEWDADVRPVLIDAIESVSYRTIWSALLHYPFEIERPYYAVVNTDKNHEIGWVAREECKPGHVPDGESLLVVQANPEWSVEHYDDPPGENVTELAELTADLFGDDRIRDPDWTDHQGWRYALPESGVQQGPLDSAADHDLYCVGDWVPGEGRLHAALKNGIETGEKIAYSR